MGTSEENFELRESRKTERNYTFGSHLEGRRFLEALLPDLAEFMLSRAAPPPPNGLERVIRQLKNRQITERDLAAVALSPLLDRIARGWDWNDPSAEQKLKQTMGRALHDMLFLRGLLKRNHRAYDRIMRARNKHRAALGYREPRWSVDKYVRAGNWLLSCVMIKYSPRYFTRYRGLPCVTVEGEEFALRLRAEFIRRNPDFLPSTEHLDEWVGYRSGGYPNNDPRVAP
jgi:hypothetical protein